MSADPLRARQTLAERTIKALYERDLAAQELGVTIVAVGPGYAKLQMQVRPDMLNGHGVCHGGRVFGLADTAFAYACNSYNVLSVAAHCEIDFVRPGTPGATLIAIARERSRGRKMGVYDVEVTDADGQIVALFRGKSYTTGRPILPDEPAAGE